MPASTPPEKVVLLLPRRSADELPPHAAKLMLLAGLSNCPASTVLLPLDVIKIRLQLDNELTHHTTKQKTYNGIIRGLITLCKNEGVSAMYKGWTASMMREMSYSATRMGAYEPIKYKLGATDRHHTSLHIKLAAGATAAGVGAVVTSPIDLVKIQMQSQVWGAAVRHTSTLGAFLHIYRVAGIRGLWTGVSPSVCRGMAANSSQIASYDHTKHTFLNHGIMEEGVKLHVLSSFIAGFFCALFSAPFDNIKTRMMNKSGATEGTLYSSPIDAALRTLRSEGLAGLYKGFLPFWMRISPHTVISFVIFEQLRKIALLNPI